MSLTSEDFQYLIDNTPLLCGYALGLIERPAPDYDVSVPFDRVHVFNRRAVVRVFTKGSEWQAFAHPRDAAGDIVDHVAVVLPLDDLVHRKQLTADELAGAIIGLLMQPGEDRTDGECLDDVVRLLEDHGWPVPFDTVGGAS